MTAATQTRSALSHLTFGGILRSEWIKLRSLRSTYWCYAIVVIVTVGIGFLVSLAGHLSHEYVATDDLQRSFSVRAITSGTVLSALVVSVLGALVITGEYGTGMIRSTLTAVPKRLPALIGKALVFGVSTFVVALVSLAVTILIVAGSLPRLGIHTTVWDSRVLFPVLGDAGFLALLGVLALAVGTIVRNSAAGIAGTLGLVLVLPIVLSIVAALTHAQWLGNVQTVLPGNFGGAGAAMYSYVDPSPAPAPDGVLVLDPTQGTLIEVAWVVVGFVIAAVLLKRRDA